MGFKYKCSGCGLDHDIDGVLTQEQHVERLNTKNEENRRLKESLVAANSKVKDFEAVVQERDTYRSSIEGVKQETERKQVYDEANIPEAARAGFEVMFASAIAGLDEDKRPSRADWLAAEETRLHPLLAPHFAGAAGGGVQQKQVVIAPPKIDNGVVRTPDSKAGPKNSAELQAYLASSEYRSLPRPDQRKVLGELKSRMLKPTT